MFVDLNEYFCSDTDNNTLDTQVPFLPSTEVSVKALVVISSAALAVDPNVSMQVMLCAHHPYIVGSAKKDAVWTVNIFSPDGHGYNNTYFCKVNFQFECRKFTSYRMNNLLYQMKAPNLSLLRNLLTFLWLIIKEFEFLLFNQKLGQQVSQNQLWVSMFCSNCMIFRPFLPLRT